MEIWIPLAGIVIAFSALWWKLTTSVATKADLQDVRRQIDDRFKLINDRFNRVENDIRELRQLWTTHLTEHHRFNDRNDN